MSILRSKYKDRDAVLLENEGLAARFLPEDGGKLASLLDRQTGRELLVQASGGQYRRLFFDGDYVDAECSGFDDMFPTIDQGFYEREPWRGTALADHGEVCGLPWGHQIDGGMLTMRVHGVRFPYTLEKTVCLQGNSLRIEYVCQNLSPYDMDFLWAAHLMLNACEGGEILVPYATPAPAVCVYDEQETLGRYGSEICWPTHTQADGQTKALNVTGPRDHAGNNYKYYFKEKVPEGRCGYRYPDGTTLMATFDREAVPYLGIWVNEGSFKGHHNVALELCTAAYDRPDRARLHGQYSVLPALGTYQWWLSLSILHE